MDKQIEEMYFDLYSKRVDYDIETKSGCEDFAVELIEKGWRKIPENAVVLTKEEYEKGVIERDGMRKQISVLFDERDNARKETASEFALFVKSQLFDLGNIVTEDEIDIMLTKFIGVEVE